MNLRCKGSYEQTQQKSQSKHLCLSDKPLISPSILNEILAGYSNPGCRFFPFSTLNISSHSLLTCRVSAERSAVMCMGSHFYVTCCFSLTAFNILSLCLVFVSLISMSWHVSPWVYPVWTSSCLLDLIDYFPFHVGEIFNYNFFKNFLIFFLLLFLFWDPYNSNAVVFDIVPEVSETILSSFHSFYFILLFRSYFHHFIFQLTDIFFCFRYSAIDSFQSTFNLVLVLFVSVCLFFNSSTSLLIDTCIFSIFFSRFLIIFTIIILNSFSGSFPISSSFGLLCFQFVPSCTQFFSAFSIFKKSYCV